MKKQIRDIKQAQDFGEVMTKEKEVEAMLNLLGDVAYEINSKILEPSCGTGNFLIGILKRKFKKIKTKQELISAVSNLYAVDILEKHVYKTRKRVFDFTIDFYENNFKKAEEDLKNKLRLILEKNIIQRDFLKKGKLPFDVKFDCIIGNPPYHVKDGGLKGSAVPVYNKFIQKAKRLNARYIAMIIPAKWYSGGKGLKTFREEMLKDRHIKVLVDFIDAKECFKEVFLRGGVCYFLRDREYKGDCKIVSHLPNKQASVMIRPLKEKNCDIFVRYNEAVKILKKVQDLKEPSLKTMISSQRPFGLRTFFKGEEKSGVKVYANKTTGYIKENEILKNRKLIGSHKVLIPRAMGLGKMTDKIKPIYSEPDSICTETYNVFGPFNSKKEAQGAIQYINTKFFRFLLALRKNTMMAPKSVYAFIPVQNFKEELNDDKLYKKYNLTKKEIEFINSLFET